MGMYELAHNSCYVQDGVARYRDYKSNITARDLTRNLMVKFNLWKYGPTGDNELVDNDIFDETMMDNLYEGPMTMTGLIALLYRNLWAMANLRERLKRYEDAEEHNNGWIPVEDNKYILPVVYEKVLITYKTSEGTKCCEGRYNGTYWYDCDTRTKLKVLAWRPKPEPYQPKGELVNETAKETN